jgi:hypothetical protein
MTREGMVRARPGTSLWVHEGEIERWALATLPTHAD